MSAATPIVFRCLEIKQPIGTFYICTIGAKDLVRIAFADVRRIEQRDVEQYLGIERPLSPGRVSELRDYVHTVDATFPTSVILAISSEQAEYNSESGTMQVQNQDDVAKIIDGQHRIAGLDGYTGDDFQISATIFIDMEMEDQATVFATINLKQTKVSKSLAYDLYDYAVSRSPQKTCHNIAKLLNSKDGSPFRNKIKILGLATGKAEESLTQATFVDRLMRHISSEPMKDRDVLKRGKQLATATGRQAERFIFRNLFVEDKDAVIAKIVWNYFEAVSQRWPKAWIKPQRGNVLCKTTGFGALMRLLHNAYLHFGKPNEIVETQQFSSLFAKVKLTDDSFTSDTFVPGSTGESDLYNALRAETGLQG
jgi:DGQHR domain-containing protein